MFRQGAVKRDAGGGGALPRDPGWVCHVCLNWLSVQCLQETNVRFGNSKETRDALSRRSRRSLRPRWLLPDGNQQKKTSVSFKDLESTADSNKNAKWETFNIKFAAVEAQQTAAVSQKNQKENVFLNCTQD